jgi:putative hemolysin
VVHTADAATRWVTGLLGASPTAGRERISEAELRDLVAANTLLDPVERRIIDEVLTTGASLVREVMMPRTEVVFLDAGLSLDRAADLVRAEPHTRYPVVDGTHDDVVGFVHLQDLLIRPAGDARTTVGELIREVKTLPASKRVLAALSEMRREGHHLAVVVDEYGGTAGIVTLEDLIEELVGEIHDEHDVRPEPAGPGLPAELDGRLNLADFAERTGVLLPPGPYETVGGFIMAGLGRLPRPGDEVPVPPPGDDAPGSQRGDARQQHGGPYPPSGWVLTVLQLDGRRVARVGITALAAPAPPAQPHAYPDRPTHPDRAHRDRPASPAQPDRAHPHRRAHLDRADPGRADPGRADPDRADPDRAIPDRADPGRAAGPGPEPSDGTGRRVAARLPDR